MGRDCYSYAADVWCARCTRIIKRCLKRAGKQPGSPRLEHTYDSDDWPKGPYSDESSDTPQHCASGETCLDALVLPSGAKVGCWLENPLTREGVLYVAEYVEEGGEVAEFWAEEYATELAGLVRREDTDADQG